MYRAMPPLVSSQAKQNSFSYSSHIGRLHPALAKDLRHKRQTKSFVLLHYPFFQSSRFKMSAVSELSALPLARPSSAADDTASLVSTASCASSQQSAESSSSSSFSSSTSLAKLREPRVLPKDFDPSDNDVIIGRGKRARTHGGNKRLRGLIAFMIPEYQAAGSNKDEKSYIIKEIVTQIRKSSPDGGFVKFDKVQDRWVEVGCFCKLFERLLCLVAGE